MPSPTVSAPAPPALRMEGLRRALRRRPIVPSTTNVSESVAAPPSLSTVSSFSEPPLEMNVPGPATPAVRRAGDDEHVAGGRVALQIDHARIGERRHADHVALQRPAERHRIVGVAEREILPRAVQRRGACHCGERQRSVVGEGVVSACSEIPYREVCFRCNNPRVKIPYESRQSKGCMSRNVARRTSGSPFLLGGSERVFY